MADSQLLSNAVYVIEQEGRQEALDLLVHDMKDREAMGLNNSGVERQLEYLMSGGMSLGLILENTKDDQEQKVDEQTDS